jgi:hypothetical protein
MMDFKSMATPMVTDMRKLRDYDSDIVDMSLYRKLIGSFIYLVNTPPNIFFAMNTLSQFHMEPRLEHWIVAKHILTYLHGTLTYGLRYASNSDVQLHGFTDSDWVGSADEKNSTSGICFSLGSAMISWARRKQKFVALNTVEAEYIVACDDCMEAVWLCKLIFGLSDQVLDLTVIYCDNQSCMKLLEKLVFHDRLKHIEIRFYFICDKV